MYAQQQPWDRPTIDQLVKDNTRLDILWPIDNDVTKKKELQWCQGQVVEKGINNDTVRSAWDAAPDIKGWGEDDSIQQDQIEKFEEVELQPNKWRKHTQYAWRLDVDIELEENYYNSDNDEVILVEDYKNDKNEEESEEEEDESDDEDELDDDVSVSSEDTDDMVDV